MNEGLIICPSEELELEKLKAILNGGSPIELSDLAKEKIQECRAYLDNYIDSSENPVYGINTGFGSLCNTEISKNDLKKLQNNLLRSHACGLGKRVANEIVRLMLILKAKSLAFGHSGVQLQTVELLIELFKRDILPVVYEQGSLGASGDLAPLSHLCLPLIGEGEVEYKGQICPAIEALNAEKLVPVELQSKEGLALINGTQFMLAFSVYNLIKTERLFGSALAIAALSLEAFDARPEPFIDLTHKVRNQTGQMVVARAIGKLLEGSELQIQEKSHVQDPYSFRCTPQVLGASLDTIEHVKTIVTREMNAVTDNPIIFPEENKIISGGNFHGQPLALAMDFLAIAVAEIASISERRTYKLISGQRNLPAFLVKDAGLNSGFMIPQYTAASIVSQNKQLCTPSSVDTIDSSNGQEDHVSMGANSATKCLLVVKNVQSVLAIEWLVAAQAFDFRRPLKSSSALEDLHASIRKIIPHYEQDRIQHNDIKLVAALLDE
jgi:histidine ammonia-lyase